MDTQIKKGAPKDVFLHLLAVVTLYVSVVAFIMLWWQYVSVLFPDLLKYHDYYSYASVYDPIRMAMAMLIIVFPVHILIAWLIGREFKSDPEKREMRVRKWLWYITLFVSAVTIIIDLIILVNNFLKGELSTQFLFKTLTVLVVAAAVFGYYLWDLRGREGESNKPKLIAWITVAVLLASIVYGFFLIGLPSNQRARRFDEQRVNDISSIWNQITYYWEQKKELPGSFSALKDQLHGGGLPTDPETNQPYEYEITGPLSFKLCAIFNVSSRSSPQNLKTRLLLRPPADFYSYPESWDHGAGRVCFDGTINPEKYKSIYLKPATFN